LYLPHEAGVPAFGIGGGSKEIDRALDRIVLKRIREAAIGAGPVTRRARAIARDFARSLSRNSNSLTRAFGWTNFLNSSHLRDCPGNDERQQLVGTSSMRAVYRASCAWGMIARPDRLTVRPNPRLATMIDTPSEVQTFRAKFDDWNEWGGKYPWYRGFEEIKDVDASELRNNSLAHSMLAVSMSWSS
jgi:hypothetical protein